MEEQVKNVQAILVMNLNQNVARGPQLNPTMDPTRPHYPHSNEMPGPLMVSPMLNGRNYHY